jgi:hypothetical protein
MKIGNVSFNPEDIKHLTKEEFSELVKGKIDIDINEAWEKVCAINGNTKEISRKGKNTHGK